jgi:FkbM family methyltransferase
MRKLIAELAYKGEVLCARLQGIAYDRPEKNGEYLVVRRLSGSIRHAIDIGANIGDWTAEVRRATGNGASVVCVEADAGNAAALRARFDGQTGVRVIEAAATDRPGTVTFVKGEGAGSGVGYVDRETERAGSLAVRSPLDARVRVRALTLEAIVAELGDPEIDLVKCDVEGEEMAVLAGADRLFARSRIGIMQVEYNATWQRAGRSLRELFAFADGHGYRLLRATPLGCVHLPTYGQGLEDYRLSNVLLARNDRLPALAPFGPTGRARVEHVRSHRLPERMP